ncbi:MAG TPA: ABC transporter ATP-binding protein [Ornithinimicrobium sp.]|uniref:ABC transporter ATP-binding protein n=1 Tax=Ornithinimicrobium sp. TaxID=1977084 RepID=UPI002B459AF9|nr:ABC transporter ATP-binding protein [Ornithinimicrobium sp.]HKJ12183.1 ABC transporter ATP-binding protein [Ornithinimicrobium sp.]
MSEAPAAGLTAHVQVSRGAFGLEARLHAPPGSVTAVLGPNGSGKSTLLGSLAGLLPPQRGKVVHRREHRAASWWDDPDAGWHLSPADRHVGLVLADPLLFGHLSVADNVAFGPRSRGASRSQARARALEELERVGVGSLAESSPREVSTGQAQRVALARALATDPDVLLLDEPLSALDPATRSHTRAELHHRLGGFDGVTVLVTHDPLDALTLADELVFLEDGQVVQHGSPTAVITRPRTPYVAGIVGVNLLSGRMRVGDRVQVEVPGGSVVTAEDPAHSRDGTQVWLTIDPAAVALYTSPPAGSTRNVWPATVRDVTIAGQRARVRLEGPVALTAEVTTASVAELGLVAGKPLHAGVKATEVVTYPA